MLKATIEFKNHSQIIIENEREFVKFYFDRFADKLDERDFGNIVSIIYGGIIIDNDIGCIKYIFKDNTDIFAITFDECYQIKKQHSNVRVFALNKEALNNFMSIIGVNDNSVYAGATYYNGGFVWEVSKTTITL